MTSKKNVCTLFGVLFS